MTSETLVASHLDDYVDTFTFDLAGNRVQYVHDSANDADDKSVTYEYDNNDRLLTETVDANGSAGDRHTVYSYDETQQTGKTVHLALSDRGAVQEQTTNTYNLQGRLSKVEIDQDVATNPGIDTTTEYEYNDNGIRIAQSVNGSKTLLLIDENNHTGYAQILEEIAAVGGAQLKSYLIGHDVLSQYETTNGLLHLLSDGHGSTRQLVDAMGVPFSSGGTPQIYTYNAYGELLQFTGTPVTTILYSGEQRDFSTMLDNNRARLYDPVTGRFNRLDPFAGNFNDPQSLHKYLYAHGDPISGIDASGLKRVLLAATAYIPQENVTLVPGVWLAGDGDSTDSLLSRFYFGGETNRATNWILIETDQRVSSSPLLGTGAHLGVSTRSILGIRQSDLGSYSSVESATRVGPTSVVVNLKMTAKIPATLVWLAPSIDWNNTITIDERKWGGINSLDISIRGRHDGFPAYQIHVDGTSVYHAKPIDSFSYFQPLALFGDGDVDVFTVLNYRY